MVTCPLTVILVGMGWLQTASARPECSVAPQAAAVGLHLTSLRALRLVMPRAGRSAPGIGSRPFKAGNRRLVEAGGQHIRGFRRGLDYAFVRALLAARGRGACYPAVMASWILVPAPGDVPSAGQIGR